MTQFRYDAAAVHAPVPSAHRFEQPLVVRDSLKKQLVWHNSLRARMAPVFAFAAEGAEDYRGPTLLFLKERIRTRMERLHELETRFNAAFLMAAKSTRQPALYALGAKVLSGFDVSNENEYRALPPRLEGKKVFVTAPVFPGRPDAFLAKGNELCLILDSPVQYEQLQALGGAFRFGVRLSSVDLLERQNEATYPYTRFGFASRNKERLKRMVGNGPHRFCALHVHHDSGGNTPATYRALARASVDLAAEIGLNLDALDLGGGIHALSDADLRQLLETLREFVPAETTLVFEPGRGLAAGAGYALGRIEAITTHAGIFYCTLDLSADCHLHWSFPALVAPLGAEGGNSLRLRCFGPTCHEGDFIGEYCFVPPDSGRMPFERGDLLLFSGISTYSDAWNTSFNGVDEARVVIL